MLKSLLLALMGILFGINSWAGGKLPACRVGSPIPAKSMHRGMYVSLYTSAIGSMPLTDPLKNILGNTASENALLQFAVHHGFDSFSLYDLHAILGSPSLSASLSSFIQAAKNCGVAEINAIGAANSDWVQIQNYQKSAAGKFDGLLTEVEFWSGGASAITTQFNGLISMLQYMKSLGIVNSNGAPLTITSYIGWLSLDPALPEAAEAAALAQNVDRLFVHCYVKSPTNAYGYCQERIAALTAAKPCMNIYPIFSAEGSVYHAGSEVFMGDWLAANWLTAAEKIFLNSYQPQGFQYYEYAFLKLYLKN